MTRILHSIYSIREETGGPARSVPALVDHLQATGLETRLIASESSERGTYLKGLHGWEPELIHDHGIWLPANHQAAAFARSNRLPLVISPRGMLEPWSLQHHRWKKRLAWALYQRRDLRSARCLHATSAQEAAQFRNLGFRQPIIVLPNGVGTPPSEHASPGHQNGIRTALFMSRIHPKKGLPLLIDAWAALRPEGWRLRIVGPDEGGHAGQIRQLADSKGLSDTVSIEPPVNDRQKWDVLRAADLFVLPTYSENFGIVVAEALAAGLPVLTTTGTPWSSLKTSNSGWYVEPAVDDVREALRGAFQLSDDDRQAMGQRGRTMVEQQYSWAAIAVSMRDAYTWILGGGNPPACVEIV